MLSGLVVNLIFNNKLSANLLMIMLRGALYVFKGKKGSRYYTFFNRAYSIITNIYNSYYRYKVRIKRTCAF